MTLISQAGPVSQVLVLNQRFMGWSGCLFLSKVKQPMIRSILAALWAFLTPRGRYFRRTHWQPLSGAGAFFVNGVEYKPDMMTDLSVEPEVEATGKSGPISSAVIWDRETMDDAEPGYPCPVLSFEPIAASCSGESGQASQIGQASQTLTSDMIDYPAESSDRQADDDSGPAQTGRLDASAMRLEFARFYFMHDKPDAAAELLQYVQQHGTAEQQARARHLQDEFTAG